MIQDRYTPAFILISIAFQFKLQAIFILPFLLYAYAGTKKFSILQFGWIPLLTVIICTLCGRAPFETFTIYSGQTGEYEKMSFNFPSFWNLVSDDYAVLSGAAILLTIALLGVGLFVILHTKIHFDLQNTFSILIASVWTCLLFLPAMHDRYAYLLILLLIIASALNIRMTPYLIICEIVSLISYSRFLWAGSIATRTPDYLCSVFFLSAYIHFICQTLVFKKNWLPAEIPSSR